MRARHGKPDGAGRKTGFLPRFLLPLPVPYCPTLQAFHIFHYSPFTIHNSPAFSPLPPCISYLTKLLMITIPPLHECFSPGFWLFCAFATQVPVHEAFKHKTWLFQSSLIKPGKGKSRYILNHKSMNPIHHHFTEVFAFRGLFGDLKSTATTQGSTRRDGQIGFAA